MSSSVVESANGHSLVDRQNVMDTLDKLADRVATEQRPRYAFIYGDAGIGKTAIIRHFATVQNDKENGDRRVFNVRPTEAIDHPLFPFADGIRDFQKNNKNIAHMVQQFASNFLGCIPEYGPYIKGAMDALVAARNLSELDKYETKCNTIFSNYSQMIESASKKKTLILCVDDAHRLDQTSMGLLGHLVSKNTRTGILFVIAARRSGSDAKEREMLEILDKIQDNVRGRASRIDVGPFTEECYGELIRHFSAGNAADREYVHRIHEITGGNPYWLSHIRTDGMAQTLPPLRITRIIEKRLDDAYSALPDSKTVLRHAAVLGYKFDLSAISNLLGMETTEAFDILSTLERKYNLVRHSGNREYTFDHSNTHDYIYNQLRPVLPEYHRKVAEFLEQDRDNPPNPYLLAYHYFHTECKEKALYYMRAAAVASVSGNLFEDASGKLERCIVMAEKLGIEEKEIDLLRIDYAYSLLEMNKVERSRAMLEELISRGHVELESKARCHILLSRCHRLIGTDESGAEALSNAREATRLMRGRHSKQAGDAYAYLATVCDHFLGDDPATLRAYHNAKKCYQNHPQELARLHRKSGMVMQSRRAIDAMETALQTFEECKMNIEKARCLNNMGAEYLYIGAFRESVSFLNRSLEVFRMLGAHEIDIPLNNLGLCHLQNGDRTKALQCFDDALYRSSEPYNEAVIKINISTVHRKKGDARQAIEILSRLEELVTDIAEPTLRDYYGFNRGVVHREIGEWDAAIEWLSKFPVNTYKNDRELAWAKRMRALSETYNMQGGEHGIGEMEEEKVSRIFSTRRPQLWFYEADYYPCDIHVWD